MIKNVSDHAHRELQPSEIYDIFKEKFINTQSPIKFLEAHYIQKNGGIIGATVKIDFNGEISELYAEGNGRLDAVSNAVKAILKTEYTLTEYTEHSVQNNSKSDAVSYISIENDKKVFWGVGINSDITTSSSKALISAVNAMLD
jgi:2-isopropylmalate synthase